LGGSQATGQWWVISMFETCLQKLFFSFLWSSLIFSKKKRTFYNLNIFFFKKNIVHIFFLKDIIYNYNIKTIILIDLWSYLTTYGYEILSFAYINIRSNIYIGNWSVMKKLHEYSLLGEGRYRRSSLIFNFIKVNIFI
jgi:hypothetical protein